MEYRSQNMKTVLICYGLVSGRHLAILASPSLASRIFGLLILFSFDLLSNVNNVLFVCFFQKISIILFRFEQSLQVVHSKNISQLIISFM